MKSIFLFIAFIVFLSCSESTEPPPPTNIGPDTTSHTFTWTIDTFGTHSTSTLYDVAIISEDNIWAVGEIHTDDDNDKPFNAVHWNGEHWTLKRLYNSSVIVPVRGILAFTNDNMWLAAGSIVHWDGVNAEIAFMRDITTQEIAHKFWMRNNSDIYAVGYYGMLLHYDGKKWQRLDSGTKLTLCDIWGSRDPVTGKEEILALASSGFSLEQGRKILKIENSMTTTVPDSNLPINLRTIWFSTNKKYFVGGNGLFFIPIPLGENGTRSIFRIIIL